MTGFLLVWWSYDSILVGLVVPLTHSLQSGGSMTSFLLVWWSQDNILVVI
jgi:hypothetical protein